MAEHSIRRRRVSQKEKHTSGDKERLSAEVRLVMKEWECRTTVQYNELLGGAGMACGLWMFADDRRFNGGRTGQ